MPLNKIDFAILTFEMQLLIFIFYGFTLSFIVNSDVTVFAVLNSIFVNDQKINFTTKNLHKVKKQKIYLYWYIYDAPSIIVNCVIY